jgi:O-antigen/teichoic acid export membrane protein
VSVVRKLASQTALYGLTYFAGRLLNFLLTPFYTRVFMPAAYGVVNELYAYITFFKILYTYGMETGYFYFANQTDTEDKVAGTSFLSLLYTSLIFSGLLIIFSSPLARLIGYPGQEQYVIYTALILAFDTLTTIPFAYLRKHNKAARFAMLQFLNIAFNIFFNLFFLVVCPTILKDMPSGTIHDFVSVIYNPDFGVGYVFLSNVFASLLTLLLLLPELRKIPFRLDMEVWKKIFAYSWPLLILGFAGMINETLDRILLKRLLQWSPMSLSLHQAMTELGIYSAAYKLSIFMTLAIQSFRYAAEPFFFASMKDEDGKTVYARILPYFTFVCCFIFLFLMLYIPLFMRILGPAFRSPKGMAVVPILHMANLFLGIFIYTSQWYKQTRKTLHGAAISVGGAVLTIAINVAFIPVYGYLASAWATFACYFGMAVVSFIMGQRYYPVNFNVGRIALYILLAVGIYFASKLAQDNIFGGFTAGVYLLNTLMIFLFVALFIYLEKPAFLWNRIAGKLGL